VNTEFNKTEYLSEFINVTDLVNALPDSSYINTVQHITIDEAVFSTMPAPSNSRNGVLCDQLLGYATVLTVELFSVWFVPRLYNEICRITEATTELIQGSYKVVSWRSESGRTFSSEVPE
jgi:hypothetical protein